MKIMEAQKSIMTKVVQLGLSALAIVSTNCFAVDSYSQCGFVNGYSIGMSLEDAKSLSAALSGDTPPSCTRKSLYGKQIFECVVYQADPYTLLKLTFNESEQLVALSGEFPPQYFAGYKQLFLVSLGAPKTDEFGKCASKQCEGMTWDTGDVFIVLDQKNIKSAGGRFDMMPKPKAYPSSQCFSSNKVSRSRQSQSKDPKLSSAEDGVREVSALTEQEFNNQFRCPETYANEEESKQAFADSFVWYESHNKNLTKESLLDGFKTFRLQLLVNHKCDAAISNVATSLATKVPVPKYNTQKECDYDAECVKAEKEIFEMLQSAWGKIGAASKSYCLQEAHKVRYNSYVQLVNCIAHEEKKLGR